MGTPLFMCSVCVHLNGETISEEWSGVEQFQPDAFPDVSKHSQVLVETEHDNNNNNKNECHSNIIVDKLQCRF